MAPPHVAPSIDTLSPKPRSLKSLSTVALLVAIVGAGVGACSGDHASSTPGTSTTASTTVAATASGTGSAAPITTAVAFDPNAPADPKRGAELVVKMECARCHDGLQKASTIPLPQKPVEELTAADVTAPDNKHCYHCHAAILDGRYTAPKASTTARWKKNVEVLRDVPSLNGAHQRFRRGWIQAFLLAPFDLRPRLAPTMPRLALTEADARDIAAFLVPDDSAKAPVTPAPEAVREGRELFEKKGCVQCHVITGAAPFKTGTPAKQGERGITPAVRLAPDLRNARDRMSFETIVKWIKKPGSIKSDALMPETPLTEDEAQKIASFVVGEALAPAEPKKMPARLPVLDRKVSYEEVKQRVFNKICWHCHSDADYAIGDGGPGNTGGFGFPPRGLNLAAYDGILSGSLDDKGERRSVFEAMADGTPRILASLLARRTEESGNIDPAIRGMPLGLPALSPEDLQLVESWIAQGHLPD